MSDDPEREEQLDQPSEASPPDANATSSPTPETMASDTAPTDTDPDDTDDEQSLRSDVERYVRYLLVAGFSLLALIAMLRFYFAASATIDTWISQEYRSLFQALFNLAILLVAGAGIGWQARKIR